MKTITLVVVVGALGCGGKQNTTPDQGKPIEGEHVAMQNDGNMIPPEKMDEITRDLDRKRMIVSHCLATVVDNKELPKNSHGKVTLELTVTPAGRADNIKIVSSTLESKSLTDCVIGHVKDIEFPHLPKPYETSYVYSFEAM